ncbi:FtsK/SpoIIIE family DNA translocase [Limosilactobacillus sp.]|jgi:S-DNA-T family DNA segregation ATPase FtsK/SpoIIIE|uniref:FtsK/SpoIIIE family DNA translocase n=1 Tax=Limosilactobacillus sp. TaxID=2773925 RepID=UPI0025C1DA50|nr:DNA translocase FtsK [Limosilactobacillus sp.]MCH3922492.1 DNA translocase FtsK [Limosilactobacillus sp.]MCH3927174.1 DNA translocase FtsK [Limosilactobacillus sp.]
MAQRKRKSKRRRQTSRSPKSQHRLVDNLVGIIVVLLMLVGLCNLGALGAVIAGIFKLLVGASYPILMLIVLLYGAGFALYARWLHFSPRRIVGVIVGYLGLLIWLHVLFVDQLNVHAKIPVVTWSNLSKALLNGDTTLPIGGGMLGAYLFSACDALVDQVGTAVFAWILMICGVIIFFALPWRDFLKLCGRLLQKLGIMSKEAGERLKEKAAQPGVTMPPLSSAAAHATAAKKTVTDFFAGQDEGDDSAAVQSEEPAPQPAPARPVEPKITVASNHHEEPADATEHEDEPPLAMTGGSAKADEDYQLPPLDLLSEVQATDQQADLKNIKKNTKILQETLQSFNVQATVENVSLGPSVTKYELRPAVGVKVSRITHLADDLALALAAKDIRIEAPIPGKSLIGIEVPNQQVATVGFRDMFEAAPKDDNPMDVPLGRTVTGDVEMADLTKMPHLLIAGATGSGKSVAINVILTSILLKAKPHQVKMLLIDPKKVELSVYNDIPHLLSPVVSEPKKAARALGKVVAEMERRYELFAKFGVRNLKGYNQLVQKQNAAHPDDQQPALPLVLVVVDELADLMMTVSSDVEDAIVRIAQMGRAAGIHMILATQRPSVDVITGLIKANVPSRIAFAVSSGVDSRTIIDTNGAEKLLGRGDMLFEPIDQNKPVRVQGAFISDQDVEAVVSFIKDERQPEYDSQMVVSDAELAQEEEQEDEDELFPQALEFVAQEQRASTSMIQRRFRIGYNRAARIIDDLEQRGYISPANGSKPREVYKKPDQPSSEE